MPTINWNEGDLNDSQDESGASHSAVGGNQLGTLLGLRAYYPFDGDVEDKTQFNNDGTDNTSAGFVTGQVGSQAKEFDGTDDFVDLPDIFSTADTPHSVSLWMNLDTTGGNQSAWSLFNTFHIAHEFQGANGIEVSVFDGSSWDVITSGESTTGIWYHVVYSYNGSKTEVYIDGSNIGTINDTPRDYIDNNVGIGGRPSGGGSDNNTDGQIDDVRIYTRALTSDEISDLANRTTTQDLSETPDDYIRRGYEFGSVTKGLVGYYPFDGNVTDATPLGNDGTDNTSAGFVTGQVGSQAKEFDGIDDYVAVPLVNFNDGDSWAITFWAYQDSSDGGMICGNDTDSFNFIRPHHSDTETFKVQMDDGNNWDWNTSWNIGQWYHWAVISNGSEISLYQDGIDQGPRDSGISSSTGIEYNAIGNGHDGGFYWDGQIDDFRAFDRALSQPEIERLANLTNTSEVNESDTL